MSRVASATKSYDASPLKTPNFKETTPTAGRYDPIKDGPPHTPTQIVMDEYGQTPDHYYLARKPKTPPSFYQVKRRLDLQSVKPSKVDHPKPKSRQKKKAEAKKDKKEKAKNSLEKPRYDTSLGQLTKKFLKLFSDASDGIINLNTACGVLCVPKRRLYDITNVLEGAGLIQKISRNNIQWMGRVNSPCASVVRYDLESEIDLLEAKENKLDELIYFMKSELESTKEADAKYHYVTTDDLKGLEDFSQKLLIGVKTSPVVDFVEPNEKTLVISSKSTEIEAYFMLEDVSFANLVHQKAFVKENSYQVKIKNNKFDNSLSEKTQSSFLNPGECSEELLQYNQICDDTLWNEGDTVFRNAFISEEDDIAPMGKHFLLQTEDQDLELYPFSRDLEIVENYSFSLDDGEGITDLFDCGLSVPSPIMND